MASKVMSITEYSREEFYDHFLSSLYEQGDETGHSLVIDQDKSQKPDRIVFRSPGVTKDSTIELRPSAQGFDIYLMIVTAGVVGLASALSLGTLQPEARIGAVIAKAASKAKVELSRTQTPKAGDSKFCTKCGAGLPLDAAFCSRCGSKQI